MCTKTYLQALIFNARLRLYLNLIRPPLKRKIKRYFSCLLLNLSPAFSLYSLRTLSVANARRRLKKEALYAYYDMFFVNSGVNTTNSSHKIPGKVESNIYDRN